MKDIISISDEAANQIKKIISLADKDVKGIYSNNFDSLVKFIDEGIFTLIEKSIVQSPHYNSQRERFGTIYCRK